MPALFLIVILVAIALQRYFVVRAKDFRNIRYACRPSVRSCEPGDVFVVHSNISNMGRRSSPTIHVEEYFPTQLTVLEAEQYSVTVLRNECRIYNSSVLLGARQQIRRSLHASISERGE